MKLKVSLLLLSLTTLSFAQTSHKSLNVFIQKYCSDCHADGSDKGGLDFDKLKYSLEDEENFAKWEDIYDRVMTGEMPPKKKKKQPVEAELKEFDEILSKELYKFHGQTRGTVLRRLNRQEYENTLNDIFGTSIKLSEMLPEDGRSHEFDNVGESLGISMIQLQKYIKAANLVLDEAIEKFPEPKKPLKWSKGFQDDSGAKKFIGDAWKQLPDGAIVRFGAGGYPSGMIRNTGAREAGYYKVSVTGYGHQTKEPLSFSVGGVSFQAGSEKPIYGYFTFPPDKETTIEFVQYIEQGYMISVEPYGISDQDRYNRKKKGLDINAYKGPGLAIKHVTMEGPLVNEFPSKGHKLIFDGIARNEVIPKNPNDRKKKWYKPTFKIESADPLTDATKIISRVAKKAFRTSNPDISTYLNLFKKHLDKRDDFEYSLRTALMAVFCSTDFLYLKENPGRLHDEAIAARMSYFLNRTAPDDKLAELAASGKLKDAAVRKNELQRLIKKPEFDRFIEDFTNAWLNLRELDFTAPDQNLFPEYDPYLRFSMPLETRAFFKELVNSNMSVTNIVKSDFAMLNDRLAEHYGIPGVDHTEIKKVKLPADSLRGGFLTQASVLKVSANGTNTSPVLRGIWVLERIMGITPPPPPAGVPGVEPDTRGASTLRELLDKHRDSPNCNSCHQKIDPLGFALEGFNPVGSYRETFRTMGKGKKVVKLVHGKWTRYKEGLPVDASGEFADGRKFKNFQEFRDHLAKEKKTLAKALTKKLLTFATGREMGFSDREEIEEIVKRTAKNDYRLGDIMLEIVNSKIFLTK